MDKYFSADESRGNTNHKRDEKTKEQRAITIVEEI